jgi:hypothetical protein
MTAEASAHAEKEEGPSLWAQHELQVCAADMQSAFSKPDDNI